MKNSLLYFPYLEKAYSEVAQLRSFYFQKTKESKAKEKQGNFYGNMEADVLKHNCIAYLLQDGEHWECAESTENHY